MGVHTVAPTCRRPRKRQIQTQQSDVDSVMRLNLEFACKSNTGLLDMIQEVTQSNLVMPDEQLSTVGV